MNEALTSLLERYKCKSIEDQERALREVIQEIALLGLWRAKFFEHAAFYGGTALRILYGLDRFSEDLDFSLLQKNETFSLRNYEKAIVTELAGFDIDATVDTKFKAVESKVESAFVKANTMIHLLKIGTTWRTHRDKILKIKIEVDTNPSMGFLTEARPYFRPIPYSIKTFTPPDLFAGKLHALLFRKRIQNPIGRDWYDLLWYVSRSTPVRLSHLEARARQSGHWTSTQTLDLNSLIEMLEEKLESTSIEELNKDVRPFLTDQSQLSAWTPELFQAAFAQIRNVELQ